MSRVVFFVQEALRALRRSAAPSVAAIVTIVVTTLLLGVLVPVLKASSDTATEVREQIHLRIFLFKGTKDRDAREVKRELESIPHVESTTFVTPREGLKSLEEIKSLRESIRELRKSNRPNPLQPVFEVTLDDPDNLETVSAAITPPNSLGRPQPISPAIEEVDDNREDAQRIRAVTGAAKIVLAVLASLLLVASLMLVGNTIRLSIFARRREIEVMRLVGATNWFIRWPFVIEGVLVGLTGGLVAVAILWVGKVTVMDPLAPDFGLIANFEAMRFLPLVGILVLSAIAVSALGSGITLRRFLRV